MVSEQTDLGKLTARMRKALKSHAAGGELKRTVKRSLNRDLIKWWNPLHHLAVRIAITRRRVSATRVGLYGYPMLGLVVMRNTVLENPKAVSAALIVGSFEFSKEGLASISTFANRMLDSQLGIGDSALEEYLEEIFADEDYTEGRRRPIPLEYTDNKDMFFMDVMMRGDDPLQTDGSGLQLPCPLVVLLGTWGEEPTLCEVLPPKISRLARPFLGIT